MILKSRERTWEAETPQFTTASEGLPYSTHGNTLHFMPFYFVCFASKHWHLEPELVSDDLNAHNCLILFMPRG